MWTSPDSGASSPITVGGLTNGHAYTFTVTAGGTVTFAFGSVGHNVYFDNDPAGAPADIPGVNSNANVDRVFGTEGVYAFNCHIHPGMHGTITVVASNAGYP